MSTFKPESFVRGAVALSLANLISRLLGAFYKPVIARIFAPFDGSNGAVGIGLTQVPQNIYNIIFAFTSVGLNVGISRLVAERMALGDVRGARRVFQVSLALMASLGAIASLVFWVGAPWLAKVLAGSEVGSIPGFQATAPALFLTAIMAAYRGLFQGFQHMIPNAYSQILEQVVRVTSGLALTWVLVRRSVPLGAAGFNLGDVFGAVAGLIYLWLLVFRATPFARIAPEEASAAEPPSRALEADVPWWRVLWQILSVAGPIAIIGAVLPFMMVADSVFILRGGGGGAAGPAMAQYGLLSNAFMIVFLPGVFTQSIATAILPSITEAVTLGRAEVAKNRTRQALRMTMLLALPAQVGLFSLAEGLYALIYGDTAGGAVTAAMSWTTAGMMLQQTSSAILQGAGSIWLPVRNFVSGAAVKAVLTATLVPTLGIAGAAYATAAGFTVAALLNLWYVRRLMGNVLDAMDMLVKPLGGALVMAGVIGILHPLLRYLGIHRHVSTLVLVVVGAAAYGLVLLISGSIKKSDVEQVPRVGQRLAQLLGRYRLVR